MPRKRCEWADAVLETEEQEGGDPTHYTDGD